MEKKLPKEISSKNGIIREIEGAKYVNNPLVYARMSGKMSMVQTQVYLAVLNAMQSRITEALAQRKDNIISEEDRKSNVIQIEIPLMEISTREGRDYKEIEEACIGKYDKETGVKLSQGLQDYKFRFRYKKPGDDFYTIAYHTVFPTIEVPEYKDNGGNMRKKGFITVKMMTETAEHLFSLSTGYARHLGEIVPLCSNAKTPRIYIYLTSKRDIGYADVLYEDLKEYLGVLEYDEERKNIVKDGYHMYSYFKRDVLKPVQEEMKKLAKEGKIEFYFEYEPVYRYGRKRGNPDKIHFEIKPAESLADYLEPIDIMGDEYADQWFVFLEDMRTKDSTFTNTYLAFCSIHEMTNEVLKIAAPNSFVCEELQANYATFSPTLLRHFPSKQVVFVNKETFR